MLAPMIMQVYSNNTLLIILDKWKAGGPAWRQNWWGDERVFWQLLPGMLILMLFLRPGHQMLGMPQSQRREESRLDRGILVD